MSSLKPGVHDVMLCSSSAGPCDRSDPGHALRPLQARVASATPGQWRDGIVTPVSVNGWTGIELLDSGRTVWVWNHGDLFAKAPAGTPVALHALYDTLAIGSERVSVLVAATQSDGDDF